MTSDSPVSLPAARLQQVLIRQIERDVFCTADALEEVAVHARDIRRNATEGEHRVLAFVLESTCHLLAYNQRERAVRLSEINVIRRLFHDPMTQAVTCFAGKGGSPLSAADALVKAVSEALLPPK